MKSASRKTLRVHTVYYTHANWRMFYLICCDDLLLSGSFKEQRCCPERHQNEGDVAPKGRSNVRAILTWTNENVSSIYWNKQLCWCSQTTRLSPMTTPGMWTIWQAMEEPAHSRPRLRYDFLHARKSRGFFRGVTKTHTAESLRQQRLNLPREHAVDNREEEDEVNNTLPIRHHHSIGST